MIWIKNIGLIVALGAILAATLLWLFNKFSLRIRLWQAKAKAVSQPPRGLRPAEVAFLARDELNQYGLGAAIVDLATRGYIGIEKIPTRVWGRADYKITLLRPVGRKVSKYDHLLLELLFAGNRPEICLSDVDENRRRAAIDTMLQYILEGEEQFYDELPPQKKRGPIWLGFLVVIVIGFVVVGLSTLTKGYLFSWLVALIVFLVSLRLIHRAKLSVKGHEEVMQLAGFKKYLLEQSKPAPKQFSQFLAYAVAIDQHVRWVKKLIDQKQPLDWFVVNGQPLAAGSLGRELDGFLHALKSKFFSI